MALEVNTDSDFEGHKNSERKQKEAYHREEEDHGAGERFKDETFVTAPLFLTYSCTNRVL